MTSKERFIKALKREPVDMVPTFELVFYLTMEAFGKVHPTHRFFGQWDQMSEREKQLQREDVAKVYIDIAKKYKHDAIFLHPLFYTPEESAIESKLIQDMCDDEYFIMIHGDSTFAIPDGNSMMDFSIRMADEPEELLEEAQKNVDYTIENAKYLKEYGAVDGFALCSDYCLNTGPFMSPRQFKQFVFPFLKETCEKYREMGFYTIKHTDGNIMPIIDMLVDAKPDALHSIDPQAGVDIGEVKAKYGDKVCIIGNVNCGLMQTGTDEEVIESAKYALEKGKPGYGYIFSTSNCVYTGMDLSRYDLILKVYEEEKYY